MIYILELFSFYSASIVIFEIILRIYYFMLLFGGGDFFI